MFHVDLVEPLLEVEDLLGVQHDVGRLALKATGGLVHHDAGIRQREAHVLLARGQQQRAHRRGLSGAQGRHRRTDELHGVVDRKTRGHHSTGGVDVHRNFLLRIISFEKQQLRDHQGRHAVLDGSGHEDDALFQQAGKNVVGPFAAVGLLNHHRHELHVGFHRIAH